MSDDPFECIPDSETNLFTISDQILSQEGKMQILKENQQKIQKSIEELKIQSSSLSQNSSLFDLQRSLIGVKNQLDKIRENSLINEQIISEIWKKHNDIKKEFMKIKEPSNNNTTDDANSNE